MLVRHMLFQRLLCVALFILPLVRSAFADDHEHVADVIPTLEAGFICPPPTAQPMAYWCWLNGTTQPDYFATELNEYKQAGVNGLFIFDVGAKDPNHLIPSGPTFMGRDSVKAMGRAIREAGRRNMEMGLVVSSSWNAGGPWIQPKHAAMGLFRSQTTVTGPRHFSATLPFPSTPKKTPKGPDGRPLYAKDVAVLAVPQQQHLPGHEFVFKLPSAPQVVGHAILYNTLSDSVERYGPSHLFTKSFSISVSDGSSKPTDFHEILHGMLKPDTKPQRFNFKPTQARFVKLTILSGYNAKFDRVELGEFELYSTAGVNVVSAYHADGSRTGATLLSCTSALGSAGETAWTAANIHDRAKSGPDGSWSSDGPPPLLIKDPASIINLSDRVDSNGHLTWNVPSGKWEIIRFICTNTGQQLAIPSPNSQGLAIDHFNPEATEFHFRTVLDRLRKETGPFEKTALKIAYVCSYELRGAAWTPRMLTDFQERRGYDMTTWLPALFGSIIRSPQYTTRFRFDYRKTLGDLLVDAFYKRARAISNEYGLLLCAEAGGPGPPLHQVPVDALKALGAVDIPRGEFWVGHNVWVVKETACAAHIYGKQWVDMEAFTSFRHWQDGPAQLKPIADRALCGGTNHFTFHTGSHSPPEAGKPGWVYHAGTHINPRLAWWPMARPLLSYLARCSFLLQQGRPVSDVCYYYGDQGFNFVPPKHIDPALGFGYDYDVTNAEVMLTRMQVQDGCIVLPNGIRYQVLVLPDREDIDLDVLRKIEQLVAAGATVIGPKPTRSNGLGNYVERDRQVRSLANRIWRTCNAKDVKQQSYGKGRIIWGSTLCDALAAKKIHPDFQFVGTDSKTALDYIHRRTDKADIYFVRNVLDRAEDVTCTFRVHGRSPEIWSPDTGRRVDQLVYRLGRLGTTMPLHLGPHGSIFVIFQRPIRGDHIASILRNDRTVFPCDGETTRFSGSVRVQSIQSNQFTLTVSDPGSYLLIPAGHKKVRITVPDLSPPMAITGSWQVSFPDGWGAPSSIQLARLIPWTKHPNPGVRYFSGIARYEKEFPAPAAAADRDNLLTLDLGKVHCVADVWLNAKHLGILWKPPFQIDITDAIQPGKNHLVVDVANTWSNRLTGDAQSPDAKPFCSTNMQNALTWQMPWQDAPLLPSGLLGPVRIISKRHVTVDSR